MNKLLCAAASFAAVAALVVSDASPARACGGCFHASTDRSTSVITDHRMVLSISTTQTVLWDQVRYSGDPSEFAWVLPVRDGARIELARGELIDALDGITATSVKGPDIDCPNGNPTSSGGGGGAGGGCGGSTLASLETASGPSFDSGSGTSFEGGAGVQVISQSVVGPYQAVTLRAGKGDALDTWLTTNGFDIPDAVVPIISAYAREGFDFIALRLRPGLGVRAMQPVRVVTPGASPALPLRMVTAGIGANVGLTLWVISEGRWHTKNFPEAVVDQKRLAWDPVASKSNYRDLVAESLAANGGRGWVTEYARRGTDQSVSTLYRTACIYAPRIRVQCEAKKGSELPWDGGSSAVDAGGDGADADGGAESDAGDLDGGVADASPSGDAQAPPRGNRPGNDCFEYRDACDDFDDMEVALKGLHRDDVWITKLRAALPATECSADLVLESANEQREVKAELKTDAFTDPKFDPCAGSGGRAAATDDDSSCACRTTPARKLPVAAAFFLVAAATVVARLARRKPS